MKDQLIKRYPRNPVISREHIPFPAQCVFNSGAAIYNNEIHMALNCWNTRWEPKFMHAWSSDGINFTIDPKIIITQPKEYPYGITEGIFDTRVTYIAEDKYYYITYNVSSGLGGRIRLCRTRDFNTYEDVGFITGIDHRNCVIFPEKIDGYYVRLERPNGEGITGGDIYISYSKDLLFWGNTRLLLQKGTRYWESCKIGPGAPPIKTESGWLVIYHGCRGHMNGIMYNAGAMLLDLKDPSKIIGKMRECLMYPEMLYEQVGNVENVIFPTAVLCFNDPDTLNIYYGCADSAIGLATVNTDELIERCLADGPVEYKYAF